MKQSLIDELNSAMNADDYLTFNAPKDVIRQMLDELTCEKVYVLQMDALVMRNPQERESKQETLAAGTSVYTRPQKPLTWGQFKAALLQEYGDQFLEDNSLDTATPDEIKELMRIARAVERAHGIV